MNTVTSPDGTTIAYDRSGSGPPLILVGGAFSYRAFKQFRQLAELLNKDFTVYNYDRRGRGESSDTVPYAVEREIEDLGALIDDAGGAASVWGLSSGAVLALEAAVKGLPITCLGLYEPPFIVPGDGHRPPPDYGVTITELVSSGRRSAAVSYAMKRGMGVPAAFVLAMRLMPSWKKLKALAHTLPYDAAIMEPYFHGKPLEGDRFASVTTRTIVFDGSRSPAGLRHAAGAITNALSDGKRVTLEGQSHVIDPKAIAPVLTEFMTAHRTVSMAER